MATKKARKAKKATKGLRKPKKLVANKPLTGRQLNWDPYGRNPAVLGA